MPLDYLPPDSPTGAPLSGSGTTGASANNITFAAVANATKHVTGFTITGAGATAGSTILVTLTGTIGGTLNWKMIIPAGAGVAVTALSERFPTPLRGTGPNVAVTLNVPSFGAGNTDVAVNLYGFKI